MPKRWENDIPKLKEGTPNKKKNMGRKPVYSSHIYEMKEGEQAIDQTPTSKAGKGNTIVGGPLKLKI